MTKQPLDLDALVNPERFTKVTLCGKVIAVRPLNAVEVLTLAEVGELKDAEQLRRFLDVVRGVLGNALTPDEIAGLSVEQLGAVIGIARAQIGAVEDEAGN